MENKNKNPFVSAEELARQLEFAKKNRSLLLERFGHKPKACVHIFGCQQNVSDGERLQGLLVEMGFEFTDTARLNGIYIQQRCRWLGYGYDP